MSKKIPAIAIYTWVNQMCSINYSSLRVYEQIKKQFSADDFKFAMPFEKSGSWADAKMTDVNSIRERFLKNYYETDSQSKEQYTIIDNEVEKSKEYLQYVYNVLYENEKSFDEMFDGFLCKVPDLLEFVCILEMQPLLTNNPNVKHLIDAYSTYISNLFYQTITQSTRSVVEQLSNDFNRNGTPSLYKGIIENSDVVVVSEDKLKTMRKEIESTHKEIKSKKTRKYSGLAYTQAMADNKYKELDLFLGQLEDRLKAANTDVVNTLSNKIVEGTMDYLTGFKLDKKPEVKEIYATRQELNYIDYLRQMMNYALFVINENTMQENKQKGEAQ